MVVIALETDREQLAAIRHAVCDLVGARLVAVESVGHLVQALRTQAPDLMLLPALIRPADEATLVEHLRSAPELAHIETLITPMLARSSGADNVDPLRRRWGTRRSPTALTPPTDPAVFAERVTWSLDHARDRRSAGLIAPYAVDLPVITETESSQALMLADAPASLLRMLQDADETLSQALQDPHAAETTTRLLQKINADRRVHRRFSASELNGIRDARIKFGPHVSLIDVSAGGALLESDTRLPPESEAMLELIGSSGLLAVPFRVLRCQVAALGQSMRYRGACAFKTPLNLSELLDAVVESSPLALPPARLAPSNAW
jgi:PilZ domain